MSTSRRCAQAVETVVAAAAGAGLAWVAGRLVDDRLGTGWVAPAATVTGALNGAVSGVRRVYQWSELKGVAAFVLDSTWALPGTAPGVVLNAVNSLLPGSGYSPSYSVRRNRHVFARGVAFRRAFATTLGNVVTNASLGLDDQISSHHDLIELHEDLHIWQQRWFGPLYQVVYGAWAVIGALVATVFGLFSRRRRRDGVPMRKLVETAAYYDNPFEYWAFRRQGRWETCGAHPALKWGTLSWGEQPGLGGGGTDFEPGRGAGRPEDHAVYADPTTARREARPMAAKFEIYTDKGGRFRFRLKAPNGQIIASSEAYNSKAAAKNGIESIKKNAAQAEVVEV